MMGFRVVLPLALAALALGVAGQDPRWRLIPPGQYKWLGSDTALVAPLPEIREAAGLRVSDRARLRACAWEISRLRAEGDALRLERSARDTQITAIREQMGSLSEQNVTLADHLAKARRKARLTLPLCVLGTSLGVLGGFYVAQRSK